MDRVSDYLTKEEQKAIKKLPIMIGVFLATKVGFQPLLLNNSMCSFLESDEEQLIGDFDVIRNSFIHPMDYAAVIDSEIDAYYYSTLFLNNRFRCRSGVNSKFKWINSSGSGRYDASGDLIYYVSYSPEDMEEAFRTDGFDDDAHRAALFDTILSTTQTAIFWKDTDRRFLGANRAFLEYYDFASEADIIGKNDEDMGWHTDPGPFKTDEERVLAEGLKTTRVHGHCISHGENRDIVASKSPIFHDGKIIGLVGSFEDVTEEYHQREEINNLNISLVETLKHEELVNKSISQLLSRTSHEIRTPMNAIIGLSELGIEESDDIHATDYLKKIKASGYYLLGIINDILDMNKMDDGKLILMPKRFSLMELLDNINNIIIPLAEEKDVNYSVDLSGVTVYYAVCDPIRVQQIVINLLNNAVKFTDPGGDVKLICGQENHNDHLMASFIVKDTGCGIKSSFMPKLFTSFAQENRNPSKYGTGTGLGLSISRNLARMMGGDIIAESVENAGSTFTATMKLGLCGQEDETESPAVSLSVSKLLEGKHVLLAEDNALNREVATGILNHQKMIVDIAVDGSEAVKLFSNSTVGYYDAILMDIQMPVMDGYEASGRIREMNRGDAKSVPIIALTADVFASSIRKALSVGMNDLIAKPINMDNLYGMLKKNIIIRQEVT